MTSVFVEAIDIENNLKSSSPRSSYKEEKLRGFFKKCFFKAPLRCTTVHPKKGVLFNAICKLERSGIKDWKNPQSKR